MTIKEVFSFIKKYETVISSVAIILFIIILTIQLLLPNMQKVNEIYNQRDELKLKLAKLQKKEKILSSLDQQYYKENFSKLSLSLPETKDFVLLFTTFDQLQTKTGVSILRTDFQLGTLSTDSAIFKQGKPTDTYKIPLNLKIAGNIEQIIQFLDSLSDFSGRLITINNIRLEIKNDEDIIAMLDGSAFFYPIPRAIGSIDSSLPEMNQNQADIMALISRINLVIPQEAKAENIPVGIQNLFYK